MGCFSAKHCYFRSTGPHMQGRPATSMCVTVSFVEHMTEPVHIAVGGQSVTPRHIPQIWVAVAPIHLSRAGADVALQLGRIVTGDPGETLKMRGFLERRAGVLPFRLRRHLVASANQSDSQAGRSQLGSGPKRRANTPRRLCCKSSIFQCRAAERRACD